MRKLIMPLLLAITGAVMTAQAQAGRSCEENRPTVQNITRGMALAERTMQQLDRSGHQVVLLARAGQDLSRYGLRYSHLGIAYRQPDGQGGHAWRVLHKLNQCGTSDAALYLQGLGEFFLDDPWRYEGAFIAPNAQVQEKLHALLMKRDEALALHVKPYSIVSYAWGQKYQQSNQWVIETMALAMAPNIGTRLQAQAWLQLHGYEPSELRIDALTRLGGRISAANVAFDDHPSAKRFSDRIETVTVDSIFAWLQRSGLGSVPVVVR
ncbi:DUF2145 domain-containing protein [Noviherbaspirillum malthae]|jgi:hypothetical protein|uniref:DUF2145 domain-containing protein n=1 Tax=Noviherbaspirillum malthae TaxID=1260987 RepID=UPI00188F39E0|nr:DUF2145 domain-containing protein [Noviherbaspirillum malthae]